MLLWELPTRLPQARIHWGDTMSREAITQPTRGEAKVIGQTQNKEQTSKDKCVNADCWVRLHNGGQEQQLQQQQTQKGKQVCDC